jgi:hypothetical protein
MRCPHCGVSLASGTSLCTACGVATSVAPMADRGYRPAPLPPGPYDVVLGPSETLSAAFRMWSRDWGRLVVLALLPLLASLPLMIGAGVFAALRAKQGEPSLTEWIAYGGVAAVAMLLLALGYLASMGAVIATVDERERTGHTSLTIWEAFLHGLSKSGRLFVVAAVTMLVGMVVGAGVAPIAVAVSTEQPLALLGLVVGVPLIAGAIWLLLRLSPLWVVAVVEDIPLGATFGRAFALTHGELGNIFVCGLVYGVVAFGINMAAGIIGIIPIFGWLVQIAASLALMSLGPTWQFALYAGLVRNKQS